MNHDLFVKKLMNIAEDRQIKLTEAAATDIGIFLEIEKKKDNVMELVFRNLKAKIRPVLDGDYLERLYQEKNEECNKNEGKLYKEGFLKSIPPKNVSSPAAKQFFFMAKSLMIDSVFSAKEQKALSEYCKNLNEGNDRRITNIEEARRYLQEVLV
jgi:hypothetical protein